MSQFTTAEETALTEAYLQCDLSPSKKPDFALVIAGWPYVYTCNSTYAVASGAHNLSTNNGFSTAKVYAWMKLSSIEIASSKLKEGIPEAGGFSIGKASVELLDKHGESTTTRDLTALLARQALREGNVTGAEYELGAALTKGATAITLVSTTGLSNGDTIWIGSEAILIGTVASSTSLTGCTRGYLLTNAVPHETAVKVYGYLPSLKGRPFWIYKGYQALALSEWLPMWGGSIEDAYRSEPAVVKIDGRPTEWDMWGGSAASLKGFAPFPTKAGAGAKNPPNGARKIVRLGQIADESNEDNASVHNVYPTLSGDFTALLVTNLSVANASTLGDGHFALKLGDYWFGIASVSGVGIGDGEFAGQTVFFARLVRGLVTGGFPDLIEPGATFDLAWSPSTFSASAAVTGTDSIDTTLSLLTSTGQATNGAYDTYERGIGLGIAVERINLASFTDVQAQHDYDDGTKVFFLFSEATPAKPFFDDELCKPFGWYLSTANDGRIKLVRPKNPTKLYFSRANNDFSLIHSNSSRTRHFKMPSGVYTPQEAASALATGLTSATGATFTCTYDTASFYFRLTVASGTFNFSDSDAWATLSFVSPGSPVTDIDSGDACLFTSTSFNTVTKNDVLHMSIANDRAPQIGLVKFGCNYNWNEDRYDYQVFIDAETANLSPYGEAPAYQVDSKGLVRAFNPNGSRTGSPFDVFRPPVNDAGCEGIPTPVSSSVGIDSSDSGATLFCEHLFDRYRNPPIRFKCRLKWKFNTKEIGDNLLLDYDVAGVFADPELAADVLSDRIFEIVAIKPIPAQACVEVELMGHRKSGAVA